MSSWGRASVRLAACAALLAFSLLPHGHLQGHEAIAAARALVEGAAPGWSASLPGLPHEDSAKGCSLCLSLARIRDALASSDGPARAVAAATGRLGVPRADVHAEAPSLPHASPRAPPSA